MGNWGCWSLLWPHFSQRLPHSGCASQWSRVRPLMWPGQNPAQKSSRWSTAANCCREQCLQPSPPFPSRRTFPRLETKKLWWLLATVPWGEEANTIKTRLCMLKSPEPGAEDQISFMSFHAKVFERWAELVFKSLSSSSFQESSRTISSTPFIKRSCKWRWDQVLYYIILWIKAEPNWLPQQAQGTCSASTVGSAAPSYFWSMEKDKG